MTVDEFNEAVKAVHGWNAAIGFWSGFYYELYSRSTLTLEAAIAKLGAYANYTGAKQWSARRLLFFR